MIYIENAPTTAKHIADLRESVGWNRMEVCYNNPLMTSFYHIACYDKDVLIGFADSVSNGMTDAYIQDVMVHPDYQGKGIGTELMQRIIAGLKKKNIYMVSCIYGEEGLSAFYKRFGFIEMLCGQMQTYEME